jgi:hypothetical protein
MRYLPCAAVYETGTRAVQSFDKLCGAEPRFQIICEDGGIPARNSVDHWYVWIIRRQ